MLYIAPLLVILHQIPLARRALLNDSKDIVQNYGYHEDWWDGFIIDLSSEWEPNHSSIHSYARMMVETQRLMAFLDGGSRRPFARVKNLSIAPPTSSLPSLKGDFPDMNPVGRFLEDLVTFWGGNSTVSSVFESSAVHAGTGELRQFSNFCTEVSLLLSPTDTLFDLVDDLVWPLLEPPETYLSTVGDIITLALRRDDAQSGAGIDVPLTFYPDRYTLPFLPFIKMLRDRRKEYQQRLASLNNQKFTMMNYMGKDTSKLLQISSDYLNSLCSRRDGENDDDEDSDEEDFDYTGLEAAAADMKRATELFAQKKLSVVEEMQGLQNELAREASLFKGEDDRTIFDQVFAGQEYPPMRVFNLSGVILSPTEYCFCRRNPKPLIDLDDAESEEDFENPKTNRTDSEFQWWKVSSSLIDQSQELPVATEITAEEVLALAKAGSTDYGSQEVVLIYATAENAWDAEKHQVPLSPALQEFIDADRHSLLRKLREEETSQIVLEGQELRETPSSSSSSSSISLPSSFSGEDRTNSVSTAVVEVVPKDCSDDEEDQIANASTISVMPALKPIKSSTGEDVTTGLMNDADADAMELEFDLIKKNGT